MRNSDSFALYRPQIYDLFLKRNDLKAWHVPFKSSVSRDPSEIILISS